MPRAKNQVPELSPVPLDKQTLAAYLRTYGLQTIYAARMNFLRKTAGQHIKGAEVFALRWVLEHCVESLNQFPQHDGAMLNWLNQFRATFVLAEEKFKGEFGRYILSPGRQRLKPTPENPSVVVLPAVGSAGASPSGAPGAAPTAPEAPVVTPTDDSIWADKPRITKRKAQEWALTAIGWSRRAEPHESPSRMAWTMYVLLLRGGQLVQDSAMKSYMSSSDEDDDAAADMPDSELIERIESLLDGAATYATEELCRRADELRKGAA